MDRSSYRMSSSTLTLETLLHFINTLYDNNDKHKHKQEEENITTTEESQSQEQEQEQEQNHIEPLNIGFLKEPKHFPEPFDQLMKFGSDSIKRCGVLDSFKDRGIVHQISLMSSLLFCLDERLLGTNKKDQFYGVKQLVEKILLDISQKDLFRRFGYNKYYWKKSDLSTGIRNCVANPMTLHFLSQYFSINLFILQFHTGKIQTVYSTETYNRFRKSIVLVGHGEDRFEPLINQNARLWNRGDPLIEAMLSSFKDSLVRPVLRKSLGEQPVTIGEADLSQYLGDYVVPKDSEESSSHTSDDSGENLYSNLKQKPNAFEEESDSEQDQDQEQQKQQPQQQPQQQQQQQQQQQEDQSDSEYEEQMLTKTNDKDIFVKPKVNQESESESESESEEEIVISMKMTLKQLQEIAVERKISLSSGTLKNGKKRMKTKKQLLVDLM